MNKKIKITLISLMLGTSLAGIATTIVSCSAAASSNRVQIDVNVNQLKNNLDNSLKAYFDQFNKLDDNNRRDYFPTKKAYNEIVTSNQLPESALNVLKSELVFKIDNKIVEWDTIVDGLDITAEPFTQQAGGEIRPMKIRVRFKDEYVPVNDREFEIETGTLGNVGKIAIRRVTLTNPNFHSTLQTDLNRILVGENFENSHQDMRKIYFGWINTTIFANFPIEIRSLFLDSIRFELEDNSTLSFVNIVETINFTSPYGAFPTGVNEKIPNVDVEYILKPDYVVSEEDSKILQIRDIDISVHTALIDVKINREILQRRLNDIFFSYLNHDNSLEFRLPYQDVKRNYDSITDNLLTMPPAIKNDIRIAIASAIEWEGYSPEPSIDDVFRSIRFYKPAFNRVPNSVLPPISMSFEPHNNSIYTNKDGSASPFVIEGFSTGSIEYRVTYANNFHSNLNRLLNESLAGLTFEEMRAKYNTWNVFNQLPNTVQEFVANNITFTAANGAGDADLGGNHLNAFETVIARSEIISTIGVFPSNYDGGPIPPVRLTLPSNIGVFIAAGTSKYDLTLNIDSGNLFPISIGLGNNDPSYVTGLIDAVQDLISSDIYFDNKAVYEGWNNITDFPPSVINLIKQIPLDHAANIALTWDDIIQSTQIIKPAYPTQTNQPIGDFIIRSTLKPIFQLNGGASSFDINLSSLESKGISNVIASKKDTGNLLDQRALNRLFTDRINAYLIEGWDESQVDPDGTLKLAYMQQRYATFQIPGAGSEYVKEILRNEIEYKYSHNNQIISVDDLFDTISIAITTRTPADTPTQLYEPITIELFFSDNGDYGNHWFVDNNDPHLPDGDVADFESKLLLKIRTEPLQGALPRP